MIKSDQLAPKAALPDPQIKVTEIPRTISIELPLGLVPSEVLGHSSGGSGRGTGC